MISTQKIDKPSSGVWKGFAMGMVLAFSIAYPAAAKAVINTIFDTTHYYVSKVMNKIVEFDERIVPKNITGRQIEAKPKVKQLEPKSDPFTVKSVPEGEKP